MVMKAARTAGFEVVDTHAMTVARYKEFLMGKCGCHFHKVRHESSSLSVATIQGQIEVGFLQCAKRLRGSVCVLQSGFRMSVKGRGTVTVRRGADTVPNVKCFDTGHGTDTVRSVPYVFSQLFENYSMPFHAFDWPIESGSHLSVTKPNFLSLANSNCLSYFKRMITFVAMVSLQVVDLRSHLREDDEIPSTMLNTIDDLPRYHVIGPINSAYAEIIISRMCS